MKLFIVSLVLFFTLYRVLTVADENQNIGSAQGGVDFPTSECDLKLSVQIATGTVLDTLGKRLIPVTVTITNISHHIATAVLTTTNEGGGVLLFSVDQAGQKTMISQLSETNINAMALKLKPNDAKSFNTSFPADWFKDKGVNFACAIRQTRRDGISHSCYAFSDLFSLPVIK